MISRSLTKENPENLTASFKVASLFGTFVAETNLASVHVCMDATTGRTYERKRQDQTFKFPCNQGAVHIWDFGQLEEQIANIGWQTLYRFVSPDGEIRADGDKLLRRRKPRPDAAA